MRLFRNSVSYIRKETGEYVASIATKTPTAGDDVARLATLPLLVVSRVCCARPSTRRRLKTLRRVGVSAQTRTRRLVAGGRRAMRVAPDGAAVSAPLYGPSG